MTQQLAVSSEQSAGHEVAARTGELAYRLGPVDVLQRGLEQARAHGAPGEMRNRLRLSAEYAAMHAGNLPPWLEFAAAQKRPALTVLREEETP